MRSLSLIAASAAIATSAQALILDLDFSRDTSGFFSDATYGAVRRATVTDAANQWTKYVDLPGLAFLGKSSDSYIGMTGGSRNDYGDNNIPTTQAGRMTIFVGGNNWTVQSPLNGPTFAIPGYVQGHTARTFENKSSYGDGSRGLSADLGSRLPEDGFTLSFNTAQPWANSKTDPLASNQYDLYTVALAHIGDALAGVRAPFSTANGNLTLAYHPTRTLVVGTGPNVTATVAQYGGDAYVVYAGGLPMNELFSGGQLFDDTFIQEAGNILTGHYPLNGELRLPVIAMEAMFKPGTRRLEPGQYDIAMLLDLGYTRVGFASTLENYAHFQTVVLNNSPASAAGEDFDGDGLVNGLEYALALDPVTKNHRPPFAVARGGTTSDPRVVFTYERFPSGRRDVAYVLQHSADGKTWSNLTPYYGSLAIPASGYIETKANVGIKEQVTASVPATGGQRFVRLKITLP